MRTAAQILLGLGFGAIAVVVIGLVVGILGGDPNPYVGFIPLGIMLLVAGTWVRIIGPPFRADAPVTRIRRRRHKEDE